MSFVGSNILAGASGQGGSAGYEIERSLRFNSGDSAYLNRTPSAAGNRRTWTWSGWVKRSRLGGSQQEIFKCTKGASIWMRLLFTTADKISFHETYKNLGDTTQAYRDPSAWYHIVLVFDTTQATNNVVLYVNNVQQRTWSLTQNFEGAINSANEHVIANYAALYSDFYLADVHFIDGQALAPTDFGETDDNGVWQPIEYAGTYGTNGFHLPFTNNSSNAALGTDTSGNGNTWTVNNLSVAAGADNDSLVDSPTNGTQTDTGAGGEVVGNYATWNPLTSALTLTDGNLLATATATSYQNATSSIAVKQGKWYAEFQLTLSVHYPGFGIADINSAVASNPRYTSYMGVEAKTYAYFPNLGWHSPETIPAHNNKSIVTGDIIGLALDLDSATKTLKTYINGTLDTTVNIVDPDGGYLFGMCGRNDSSFGSSANASAIANFGQRAFAKTNVPSGYKALCTANLPNPTIADGSKYFDTKLWTGNGGTQAVTGLNFSPSFVWYKSRSSGTYNHGLFDILRGPSKQLFFNNTSAEGTYSGVTSFNSDGFTLGSDDGGNLSGGSYVAWAWDAGTSTVTNTDGSITSQVRANPSAGFSIVSYTGTGANASFGHGLNAAPEFVILKNRDSGSTSWLIGHKDALVTSVSYLGGVTWNNLAPTSSVVNIGSSNILNTPGDSLIAYCFAPVNSYSAMGKYTGNGSADDGPFVYTGFKPAWILYKRDDASGNDWTILDSTRGPNNVIDEYLQASNSNAEATSTMFDFLSNGFKPRLTSAGHNASGGTYIYLALASHPFKTARAR